MICTLHRLLWKAGNERRDLPEATENQSQVQVGQRGRVTAKLATRGFIWTNVGPPLGLQSLAQEQSHIVCRVHQSRSCGGGRFDSDPSKRSPRGQEAKPLHDRTEWVECGEEDSGG